MCQLNSVFLSESNSAMLNNISSVSTASFLRQELSLTVWLYNALASQLGPLSSSNKNKADLGAGFLLQLSVVLDSFRLDFRFLLSVHLMQNEEYGSMFRGKKNYVCLV